MATNEGSIDIDIDFLFNFLRKNIKQEVNLHHGAFFNFRINNINLYFDVHGEYREGKTITESIPTYLFLGMIKKLLNMGDSINVRIGLPSINSNKVTLNYLIHTFQPISLKTSSKLEQEWREAEMKSEGLSFNHCA